MENINQPKSNQGGFQDKDKKNVDQQNPKQQQQQQQQQQRGNQTGRDQKSPDDTRRKL